MTRAHGIAIDADRQRIRPSRLGGWIHTRIIDVDQLAFGEFSAQFVAQLLRAHCPDTRGLAEEG